MNRNRTQNQKSQTHSYNHVLQNSQDYMFNQKNIVFFTKHLKSFFVLKKEPKIGSSKKNISNNTNTNTNAKNKIQKEIQHDNIYRPKQKDSLFWCFYILKHGISNYEINVGNQHFVIEKKEKFKYVELFRNQTQKELLKMHKIKPLSEVEFDLTNNDKISVKTFFALCVVENINVLLIDKRKKYELCMNDGDIYVIHRNSESGEHSIEFNSMPEKLQDYRNNYYHMETFESKLKCISSYKVSDLMELCRKLNINTDFKNEGKKMTKKDIYEMLVAHLF
jgi:hypothetical protein